MIHYDNKFDTVTIRTQQTWPIGYVYFAMIELIHVLPLKLILFYLQNLY